MYLLDINLLIALCDADHEHHEQVRKWFGEASTQGWATCPLTENGLLRIMGHPGYPGGPGTPAGIRPLLQKLRNHRSHHFFPDTVTLADEYLITDFNCIGPKGLTDLYLLALAVHNKASLVTLDQKIDPRKVTGGPQALICL
jgi:uncharacterized protein